VTINRIDSTPIRIAINQTIERHTPKRDFGDRMKAGLDTTAGIVANGTYTGPFQGILDGVGDLENHLRQNGASSHPSLHALLGEITLLKMQLARIVVLTKKP